MSFEDSMYSKSLGFELEEDPEEPRRLAIKGTRQLFFLFALIFGLLFPAASLYRGGAFEGTHIQPKMANLALRAEAKWDSAIVGSLISGDTVYPNKVLPKKPKAVSGQEAKAWAAEWYGFDEVAALVRPGYTPPSKSAEPEAPGAEEGGEGAEDKKAEAKEASAEALKARGDWVKAEVAGWVPASLVVSSPGGLRGAWANCSDTLITFWAIAGFCLMVAAVMPISMLWFYKLWMLVLVNWLGRLNTKIFMTVFFFIILAPAAFVMRLMGKDPLDRTIAKDDPTFWKDKDALEPHHFERSF